VIESISAKLIVVIIAVCSIFPIRHECGLLFILIAFAFKRFLLFRIAIQCMVSRIILVFFTQDGWPVGLVSGCRGSC
jgi:hypothetical protein